MTTTVQKTEPESVRLSLSPEPSRTTVLDGGWWPRSRNAEAELPGLVQALGRLRGEITHVLLNSADWDLPHPRRAGEGRGAVRLGWYTAQPHGLVTVMSDFGYDRFDLFVVPPEGSAKSAAAALAAASDPANKQRAAELLEGVER